MTEDFQDDVIKAVKCEVNLGESVLDAYMLPSGEKRLGVENIGATLGYLDSFFFDRTKRGTETLKTLRGMGFLGEQIWVDIIHQGNCSFLTKTLSIRDFVKLITYEATIKHNLKAIILLAAFAETGLERILEDAFAGRSVDFFLEKIVHYSKWTYEERQEVFAYNREEVRALRMGPSAFP
ncbi:hypothetical protein [Tychonema sp. BBK16]|uniref:hypothetical protein n=1 Tax=Tychonema sp. BBK16 TaxID=2699888 RepID=UPI001F3C9D74|nr:hypothetical protein [Tychonema sp. BBK16]MCF6374748.1 hypothetical protein [Tychonema sp. BBK16]